MPKKTSDRRKVTPKVRHIKPRIVQSWSTPQRAYVSCLATAAYDDGKRFLQIVEAVSKIVPRWKSFFPTPLSDLALVARAYHSRCGPTSKTEAPEVSAHKKPVWPIVKRDYKTGICSLGRQGKRTA